MKRQLLQSTGATLILAVALAGCAAPQRSPGPGTSPTPANNAGSTTGDADACAAALGNAMLPAGTAPGTTVAGGRQEITANGIMVGNVALVALPTHDNLPTTPQTTPGAGTPQGAPLATGATNPTALDRIRSACPRVAEIRIVTDAQDRTRLADIALALRRQIPITNYLDDIARISRKATSAAGAPMTTPGAPGVPAR